MFLIPWPYLQSVALVDERALELEYVPMLHLVVDDVVAVPEEGGHVGLLVLLPHPEDLLQHLHVELRQVVRLRHVLLDCAWDGYMRFRLG